MLFVAKRCKNSFVDIRPDAMNIDETKIEEELLLNKSYSSVHYAGVACEMDTIMDIVKNIIFL